MKKLKNQFFFGRAVQFALDSAAILQKKTEEGCLSLTEQKKIFPSIKNLKNLNIRTLRKCFKIAILLFLMLPSQTMS